MAASIFLDQSYKDIKENLLNRKELFNDPYFPPNDTSLGKSHPNVVWKRPKDIHNDPKLVVDGLAPSDLNQGLLGNCWFVAACSALALEENLWHNVVPDVNEQEWDPDNPNKYCGIFKFHFWRFGEWTEVVIDDWLPTKDGHLVFMKSKSGNEFWSALLEKAYAKLVGSYEVLTGGRTGDGLVDFTGGVNEFIEIHKDTHDEEETKKLFQELQDAHEHQSLISCSIAVKNGIAPNTVLECGLVNGHAYTIIDIREMKLGLTLRSLLGGRERLMMIKMRNPWGRVEWNGPWSDGSDEWDRVKKSEKSEIDLVVEDDGEFWMEFIDWCRWFSHATICRVINVPVLPTVKKHWYQYSIHGEWSKELMGGAMGNRIMENPQYAITVNRPQRVMINLIQKSTRTQNNENQHFTIGFIVLQVEENRIHRTYKKHKRVGQVKYFNIRDNHGSFYLESAGRYMVIPSTYMYGKERGFLLRIFTEYKANVMELTEVCKDGSYEGVVSLHIHSAQGLIKPSEEASNKGGLREVLNDIHIINRAPTELNPFCKVTLGNECASTPVLCDANDPLFNTNMVFYVKDFTQQLLIEVMSREALYDELIGEVSLPLPSTEGIYDNKRNLTLHGKGTGMTIRITVTIHKDIK